MHDGFGLSTIGVPVQRRGLNLLFMLYMSVLVLLSVFLSWFHSPNRKVNAIVLNVLEGRREAKVTACSVSKICNYQAKGCHMFRKRQHSVSLCPPEVLFGPPCQVMKTNVAVQIHVLCPEPNFPRGRSRPLNGTCFLVGKPTVLWTITVVAPRRQHLTNPRRSRTCIPRHPSLVDPTRVYSILLAVPKALEVEVKGKYTALKYAAEASFASKLPLAVDDLNCNEQELSTEETCQGPSKVQPAGDGKTKPSFHLTNVHVSPG